MYLNDKPYYIGVIATNHCFTDHILQDWAERQKNTHFNVNHIICLDVMKQFGIHHSSVKTIASEFVRLDRDKDGVWSRQEYQKILGFATKKSNNRETSSEAQNVTGFNILKHDIQKMFEHQTSELSLQRLKQWDKLGSIMSARDSLRASIVGIVGGVGQASLYDLDALSDEDENSASASTSSLSTAEEDGEEKQDVESMPEKVEQVTEDFQEDLGKEEAEVWSTFEHMADRVFEMSDSDGSGYIS